MDINLAIPCSDVVRSENLSPKDEIRKVCSELLEVAEAYQDWQYARKANKDSIEAKEARDHFYEECTDTIVALTTLLEMTGCCARERNAWRMYVNIKNQKRGYHHIEPYCYKQHGNQVQKLKKQKTQEERVYFYQYNSKK